MLIGLLRCLIQGGVALLAAVLCYWPWVKCWPCELIIIFLSFSYSLDIINFLISLSDVESNSWWLWVDDVFTSCEVNRRTSGVFHGSCYCVVMTLSMRNSLFYCTRTLKHICGMNLLLCLCLEGVWHSMLECVMVVRLRMATVQCLRMPQQAMPLMWWVIFGELFLKEPHEWPHTSVV